MSFLRMKYQSQWIKSHFTWRHFFWLLTTLMLYIQSINHHKISYTYCCFFLLISQNHHRSLHSKCDTWASFHSIEYLNCSDSKQAVASLRIFNHNHSSDLMLFHSYFGAINALDTSFGRISAYSTHCKASSDRGKMVENTFSKSDLKNGAIFCISSSDNKGMSDSNFK